MFALIRVLQRNRTNSVYIHMRDKERGRERERERDKETLRNWLMQLWSPGTSKIQWHRPVV